MWYESVNFWFGILFCLCVIGHYAVEGIEKYSKNKYKNLSNFEFKGDK